MAFAVLEAEKGASDRIQAMILAPVTGAVGLDERSAWVLISACVLFVVVIVRNQKREQQRKAAEAAATAAAERQAQRRRSFSAARAPPELRSLPAAIEELRTLYTEYKYLECSERLEQIRHALRSAKFGGWATTDGQKRLDTLLGGELSQLEARIATCKEAMLALNDEHGWELVKSEADMRMFQRWAEGNNLQVKIEAIVGPNPPVSATDTLVVARGAAVPDLVPDDDGRQEARRVQPGRGRHTARGGA